MTFAASLHGLKGLVVRSSGAQRGRTRRCAVTARRSFVARLETFEDRTLLSTFTVANLNDSGTGSLCSSHRGRRQRGYNRVCQGASRHHHAHKR